MRYFLSIGFRPFFLLSSITAIFVPMYLVCVVLNGYPFTNNYIDIFPWHGHELLFGMIPALIGGFLLTASATWTKKRPAKGLSLVILIIIWLQNRIVMLWQPSVELIYLSAPLFLLFLIVYLGKALKGNKNFYIVTGLLTTLAVLQVCYLYFAIALNDELKNLVLYCVECCIFIFLFLFSGRLVPLFTNNALKKQVSVKSKELEVAIAVCAAVIFLTRFSNLDSSIFFQSVSILTAILFLIRSRNWYHKLVWEKPMVSFMHISHIWLAIYFILIALNSLMPEFNIGRAVFHCLFSGALALFAISIMSRVSLGHTGRNIETSSLINLAFYSVLVGALTRVFLPLIRQELYDTSLHVSMGFWTLGFIFYFIRFAPIYFKPRADIITS